MSITLEKRAEKVGIILAKGGITKVPPIRVGLALDISGSAQDLYDSGVIQETVDRLIPIAMKFDDNGELDMWSFTTGFDRLESASADDEGSYVTENILGNDEVTKWGGTQYSGVLQDMLDLWFPNNRGNSRSAQTVLAEATKKSGGGFLSRLFGGKTEAVPAPVVTAAPTVGTDEHGQSVGLPAMGLLITDGECSDASYAAAILKASQNVNVYWQMIGVGPSHNFKFLKEQADLLPNVGFVNLSSLEISDDELYDQLIAEEFLGWVKTRAGV